MNLVLNINYPKRLLHHKAVLYCAYLYLFIFHFNLSSQNIFVVIICI